ncbi:MAG: nicotinate-nucleotide adenylyltransferase [Oscillospiraceae bacterium]|nr:nicotinate-nucleotide adenylyltransferase [Oscillospiraceae bacterium]
MGKLGIFGGTFNPIHNGHLHIARCFQEQLALDSVMLIPSKRPTHKAAPDLASSYDRLMMCRLATAGTPFTVSDMEITRKTASYTVYTLEALREKHPLDTLYLLMGEDMFLTLLDWKAPERICALAVCCVAPRSEDGRERLLSYGKKLEQIGGQYRLLDIPFLPISSTQVRDRLRNGLPISDLVPPRVAHYLREHPIYTGGSL